MSELLETITKSLPPKITDDYKEKFHTTIREVSEEWFIKNMNSKPPLIKRKRLSKTEQIKKDKNEGKDNEGQHSLE